MRERWGGGRDRAVVVFVVVVVVVIVAEGVGSILSQRDTHDTMMAGGVELRFRL